jgi:predicted nucleic acid-binding Zn ribbon protein
MGRNPSAAVNSREPLRQSVDSPGSDAEVTQLARQDLEEEISQ